MSTIAPSTPARAAARTGSAELRLEALTKSYGGTIALDAVDLHIPAGSLTVIVGPSGCGKSTILRVLSGLETATSGDVYVDDVAVTGQAAGDRDVAMVFQDYALYPHMTVEQNISFRMRLRARHDRRSGPSRADIARQVRDVTGLLGLDELLRRKPAQLSGGQRQRVALARAIVHRPQVLLLDEPLSALDAQLRASARTELLRLHREIESTMVLVTHDQHEALSMATHLVVMDKGRVAQSGTAEELFRRPGSEFVAAFVGSPAMNFADTPSGRVGWRATDARILGDAERAGEGFAVEGVVDVVEFTGDSRHLLCRSDSSTFTIVQRDGEAGMRTGDIVRAVVPDSLLHHFDQNGNRTHD
jgi:multiple sugar transport system ATP-binding protein